MALFLIGDKAGGECFSILYFIFMFLVFIFSLFFNVGISITICFRS